nr:Permease for cytosine/purine, uracil, thiamine, allantoin [uncultured organism]
MPFGTGQGTRSPNTPPVSPPVAPLARPSHPSDDRSDAHADSADLDDDELQDSSPRFAQFNPPSLRMPPTAPTELPSQPSSHRHAAPTPELSDAEANWTAFLQESRPSRTPSGPVSGTPATAPATPPAASPVTPPAAPPFTPPSSYAAPSCAPAFPPTGPNTTPTTGSMAMPVTGPNGVAADSKAIERLERLMPLLASKQLDDSDYLAWESRLREAAHVDEDPAVGTASRPDERAAEGADASSEWDASPRRPSGADSVPTWQVTQLPPSGSAIAPTPITPTPITPTPITPNPVTPITPISVTPAAVTSPPITPIDPVPSTPVPYRRQNPIQPPDPSFSGVPQPISPTPPPLDLPRQDLTFTPTRPTDVRVGPPSEFGEPMLAYPRLSSTGPVPRLDEELDDEYVYEPFETSNTGSIPINTGSVPIVTVVDPDLADDADDVWQPEEAVLHPGDYAPVAPPVRGQDTGPITPIFTPRLDEEAPLLLPNEVAKGRPAFSIEQPVVEPTPLEQRVGRATRMFWLWFAPNASIVTLALGASVVALGVSLRQALVAALVGTLIACLPLGITVLGAKRTGQPMAVASRATFGLVGNVVPAALQVGIRLAWAAVLLWLVGSSVSSIVLEAGWDIFVGPPIAAIVVVVLVAALGTAVATFGYWLLARVQLTITGIAAISVALVIGFTAPLVDLSVALSRPDGSWPLLVGGAMAVLGVLATAWLASGGETARYQRTQTSGSATVAWAAFGGALPAVILVAWGALLAASSDAMSAGLAADPIAALADQMPIWFPLPLLFAVLASLIAGVTTTVYSGGLTLPGAGVPLGRVPSTLIFGGVAAALGAVAMLATSRTVPLAFALLPTIAVPVLAWAGIVCTDLLTRNREIDGLALLRRGGQYPDYRILNLVALLVITVVGIGFLGSDGFGFEGYLWRLVGVDPASDLARSDLGLLGALVLGLIVPLFGALAGDRVSGRVSGRGTGQATGRGNERVAPARSRGRTGLPARSRARR